ncbi:hypothetical protein HMPREF9080_01562 [Cardiobacterium valvarum F0432]|uniref:Uncharacterized protein n=1 Tax=Cardiobacterium valvarum F0432 TaxID=797473 RepID=G9ZFL4_9GAMM|nr:WYL domain-containing protein [Cardiobacterium valvarum]EHM53852.1 hypothetical protein HMPREF9080_01562 [Cardiobacterium valvarum F0432]
MSSGESERIIVPFALVDTGLHWHVRAFDRKSGESRDFVLTRIEAPTLLEEEPQANERPDNDIQWTRIVELDLVPHPRLTRPEIIKMDYGMTDGSIRMRVRAAVAGYAAALERGCFAESQPHRRTVPPVAQRSAGAVRR